ncbi:MAG: DNA-3-methyladenine glycosylase I [Bacteroidia bacterium]|nr:DNA-3-methyladenine glycosylase I [Bacteroidia bacterium]
MLNRCEWCLRDGLYLKYHDQEWGVPVHDEQKLFEFLILEGAQAGLSWLTVLRKREAYHEAYDGFDLQKVARYGPNKILELINNKGIIRNRLKIEAAVKNAQAFLSVQEKMGSFDQYIWNFIDGLTIQNKYETLKELPAETEISRIISKDMKKRGFLFVGPTIIYAHMQATGMVNDHLINCYRYSELGGTV